MAVSGLSLESMLAMVQAKEAQRRQAERQAQQARQSEQTAAQSQPTGGARPSGCDLTAATQRNDVAGQRWDAFAPQASPSASGSGGELSLAQREALYGADADAFRPDAAQQQGEQRAPKNKLEQLLADNPSLKSNQDLINYFYAQGGGTWEGASAKAHEHGITLNKLVRDRQGAAERTARDAATETPPTAQSAPTEDGPAPTTAVTTATTPEATGVDRPIKGFREVDEDKLKAQLPPQARHLARAFIESGRKYDVDPVALVAISKHETGNFTSSAFRNKNNAMGISDRRGPTMQPSHEASIDKMAKLLGSTTSGPYKNARTIGEVANIYAPIGAENDPRGLNHHWAKGVARFADDLASKVRPAPGTSPAPSSIPPAPNTEPKTEAVKDGPAPRTAANGTATFDKVLHVGRRDQRVEGKITVNGRTYDFRSGGYGRGSLPPGEYTVTRHRDSRSDRSMSVSGVGYSFALSDKFDPRVGSTRRLLRIHPDGGAAGTEGCIGIVGDAEVQRQFRADMLAELRRNGGRFTLRVG